VDFRDGLDDVKKRKFLTLPGLELRNLGLARNQLLYRLRCPGSILMHAFHKLFSLRQAEHYSSCYFMIYSIYKSTVIS
jgi:hypothetical protein